MINVWVEKYRPKTIDEYIFSDKNIELKFKEFITKKDIPNLLLYSSSPGVGKTTIAKIFANTLTNGNYLYINASDENNVDTVRNKVKNYILTQTINVDKDVSYKIIILDEFDYTTTNAQAIYRNMMESYYDNVRFILTCNYIEKIIEPIRSRCQVFNLKPQDMLAIAERCIYILKNENIEFDVNDLTKIINDNYPDIRRIINQLQKNTIDNRLTLEKYNKDDEYFSGLANILQNAFTQKTKNWYSVLKNIRKLILENNVIDGAETFSYLYDNAERLVPEDFLPLFYIILSEYSYRNNIVIDKEINLFGFFAKLFNEYYK